MGTLELAALEREAVSVAERLLERSAELTTRAEVRDRARLARVLAHSDGIPFLARLLDRAARPRTSRRLVEVVRPLLASRPRLLGAPLEIALDAWAALAPFAPALAAPPFLAGLRHELHRYLIRGDAGAIARYVERRRAQRVRVNLNWAGEAVLSDAEAERWLARCERALAWPFVEALSVKVSALCPRPHPLAGDALLPRVVTALGRLYRQAGPAKLVSLDMESFADLEVTIAAFRIALDQPTFRGRTHGLALQAYLPDSSDAQRALTGWARERVAAGGAPIRIRLVKGANLAAERFEARLRGLVPPTFGRQARHRRPLQAHARRGARAHERERRARRSRLAQRLRRRARAHPRARARHPRPAHDRDAPRHGRAAGARRRRGGP